ncbi:transglycosylase family protein [Candidatus Poriferisocius sp.]|uniref:transglycosylase family protein n=1 Tax=Candidatus Poriferisocius sp. TaxID=3101276 RepID=UPI003B016194
MAASATLAVAGGVAVGQSDSGEGAAQPVAVESAIPAWRDLARAQEDLELALGARDAALMAMDRTVDALHLELARLDELIDVDSGRQLLKGEAEQLVVQEYMSGGDVEDLVFILGVSEATDALWREALLSELSEVVDQALSAVDNVFEEQERTEARIGRLNDAIPYLNSRLNDAEQSVEAAEWVVYIAEINDMADRELAQSRFIEPTERHWYNLRFCESTNNYTAESSNGLFYGAYQFEPRTWRTVGGTGNPAHAPPEEQDARARLLYARRGDQPWPRDYCGRWLPAN